MNTLILTVVSIVFLYQYTVQGDEYCCCCERSGFYELSRIWVHSNDCKSPKICCNIPSKYECELELNPTFDGSCGHLNERTYQKENNGSYPILIPRNGYSDNKDIYGWFGERLIDNKGNEIQEWCFDNDENDSFYLWRFVNCNGTYPNWFGRCSFPSATNTLTYKTCNDEYHDFTSTIPNCFGQIQHTNIGLSYDKGKDIDYRYSVSSGNESIWCSEHNKPKDPPSDALYNGHAFGKNDGFVPFYLSECRGTDREPEPLHLNVSNEMTSFSFRINIELDKKPLPLNEFAFILSGNNIPSYYEAVLNNGDYWSLGMDYKILNVITPKNDSIHPTTSWISDIIESRDGSSFVTFTYYGDAITLNKNIIMKGFQIKVAVSDGMCSSIGWIARSALNSGHFDGYGKIQLC